MRSVPPDFAAPVVPAVTAAALVMAPPVAPLLATDDPAAALLDVAALVEVPALELELQAASSHGASTRPPPPSNMVRREIPVPGRSVGIGS